MFLQHIINSVMYRTEEEASDPLNNKLVRQSLPSFQLLWVRQTESECSPFRVAFPLYRYVSRHLRCRGFAKLGVFFAKNYVSEQFAN